MLMITHDLAIAEGIADRVHIMYAGEIVEKADRSALFSNPAHPYTKALLKSAPGPDSEHKSRLFSLEGAPPDLIKPIIGCAFSQRCSCCMPVCLDRKPGLAAIEGTHEAACWKLLQGSGGGPV